MLDLARELVARGHAVTFYSMLPDSRVETFGLDRRLHRSLLPSVAPLAAWQHFAPQTLPAWHDWALSRILDRAVASVLEPCDVLICMSGIFIQTIRSARSKFGAQIWLERGSRHIESQSEIPASVPGARRVSASAIARKLEGYYLADRIVVPSRHVAESFERDPVAHKKLFVNAYGTDLDLFPYAENVRAEGPLKLVFAGAWSLRKGCDVFEKAVQGCSNIRLQHLGAISDYRFPAGDERFHHVAPVPQSELSKFCHVSDAFVHASREEGLSVVQAQALASGLPIICTDRTGGEDLGHTVALRDRIIVVPLGGASALQDGIEQFRYRLHNGLRFLPVSSDDRATLSWSAYGARYANELIADTRSSKRNLLVREEK